MSDLDSAGSVRLTLEQKLVSLANCTTSEVVALREDFELIAWGTRCSLSVVVTTCSTVDREEVFDPVSGAMASATIRCYGTTC